MKEALQAIIENLVLDKDSVSVNETINEKVIDYKVKVAETDMGKVIGKDGKVAHAIRTVMNAIASKEGKKITVEFID